jgi:hypothetical protein
MATRFFPRQRPSRRDEPSWSFNMSDQNNVSQEIVPASFVTRVLANDALKRGVAAAATGAILAAIMELAWPSE